MSIPADPEHVLCQLLDLGTGGLGPRAGPRLLVLDSGLERLKVAEAGLLSRGAEGGRADRPEPFPSTPVVFVGQVLGLLTLGSRLRVGDEPAAFSSLGLAGGLGHR